LTTDQGLLVKKDITAGGFLSSNQGALYLGRGLTSQVDDPKIILMHSGLSRLDGVPTGLGGTSFPTNPPPSEGDYFFRTDQDLFYKYNGSSWDNITAKGQVFVLIGAPILFFRCTSYNPQTQVATWDESLASDYSGKFDTLYITKFDGNPAHLDLGDLTVHGGILIGGDTNLYRSGPNQLKTDDSFIVGNYGSISSAGDAIFNSVLCTANGAFKVGTSGGTTYVSLTRSGSTGYINAHFGNLHVCGLYDIYLEPAGEQVRCDGDILPVGAGTWDIGTSTADWNYIYANYLRYDVNIDDYDALDDLGLAKNYKTKTVTKNGVETTVIDMKESFPFLVEEEHIAHEKLQGYLLGCIKALALRVEALETVVKT
jgi:hypothetical protein